MMKEIPKTAQAYKKTDVFNEETVPKALLVEHSTKANVWGKIIVLEGELIYSIPSTNEELLYGVSDSSYKAAGKESGSIKLCTYFYTLMDTLPEAKLIRDMHKKS